jgi:hypothetical protein
MVIFSGARTVTSGSSMKAAFDGDEFRIGHRRQVSISEWTPSGVRRREEAHRDT